MNEFYSIILKFNDLIKTTILRIMPEKRINYYIYYIRFRPKNRKHTILLFSLKYRSVG